LKAFENRLALAERAKFDGPLLKAAVAFAIDNLLAFAVEHRFAGDRHGVRELLAANSQARSKARAEARVGFIEKHRDVEFVGGIVVPEFMGGRASDRFHLASEFVAGQRVNLNVDRLTRLEIAVIGLADLRVDLEVRNIDHFCDRAAGIHLIADVVVGKGHAGEKKAA